VFAFCFFAGGQGNSFICGADLLGAGFLGGGGGVGDRLGGSADFEGGGGVEDLSGGVVDFLGGGGGVGDGRDATVPSKTSSLP
jgi:hypothetical protein